VTGLPAGARPWFHDLARFVAGWLFRPAFRISVTGLARVPRSGPVVLVANHTSLIEPQLLFGLLPRRSVFLVKEEMFHGLIGRALVWLGQLRVRRGTPDRTPMLDAVRVLRAGGMVAVFPEGSRGSGDVRAAQFGAAWLVRSSGAVVVPVAVRGTQPPQDGKRRFRPRVDVLVDEPFPVNVGRGSTGLAEGTEQIRARLAETVARLDAVRASRRGRHERA
jgi:1-acyl-sn-glycerol-3-phosphate acyltransferase